MSCISRTLTGLGFLFLAHACYSAHEHSTSTTSLTSISATGIKTFKASSLPIDISTETVVAIAIICLGLVLGTPELRPIQWREWAGRIEREDGNRLLSGDGLTDKDYIANPFKVLESRPGFLDIRKQRREFTEWKRGM
ncbi:hypothetical protein K3495_g2389 [Podosphaera aphanis]|nr:hypothetical protein K3495_g2389 [Podosphaera aphanis]